jgi:SAM-dependent methyltransferase
MTDLLTLSRSDLDALGAREFQLSLDKMTLEAIKGFKSTRSLPDPLAAIAEKQIIKLTAAAARKSGPARKKTSKGTKKKASPKAVAKKATKTDGYVPFPERFKAWWNGTPVPPGKEEKGGGRKKAKGTPPRSKNTQITPSSDGIPTEEWMRRIRDRVWGEGFIMPGGGSVILNMAKLSEMQPEDVSADILPGCVGPALALNKVYPNTVTCFEATKDASKALQEAGGEAIRAQVLDMTNPDLGIRAFDRIFCREVMCFIPNREVFLRNSAGALRGGGRFVFNDLVRFPADKEMQSVEKWRKLEPAKPILWTFEEYQEALVSARLELKNSANITKSYVAMVETKWRTLAASLTDDPLPPEGVDALMSEGEIWQARIEALKTGQVGIIRFSTQLRTVRSLSGPG